MEKVEKKKKVARSGEKLFWTLEISAAQLFPFVFTKQSKLRSSWPSSVWKLVSPVCGSLLLVEWACETTEKLKLLCIFIFPVFLVAACTSFFKLVLS